MPIEIRELVIKARVEEAENASHTRNGSRNRQASFADKEAIIAACVEQVLQIMADKQER
ncbi:DUF5908 family protein [Spirosoma pollinicola]|uniref:DUF5908 family protein n=1 Tax=Spirosoma pollinicola TaxID=2057025 RepID=UPI001473BADC|nr:DUF5908 family protein [Spirosoma pollinicola]